MTSEVPLGWRRTPLGEFTTLQRGIDLPASRRKPGNIPILGSFGVTGWHDEARAVGPGVTVGRSGTIGIVSYSSEDFWPLNTALYVKDFHGNDARFAYYFLKTFPFKRYDSGSVQPSLNRNFVHPVEVIVPAVSEQRRIAAVLGALDDKIELNRKMNQTLEEMAQAIFKSWFIDFDGVPESDMVESELGMVPKGWEVKRADEIASVAIGRTPPRKEPQWFSESEGDVRWMSIRDLGACEVYIHQTRERLTAEAVERFRVRSIPDQTVVLSFKLTVGRVAITVGEMLSNEAIAHFVLPEGSVLSSEYLYSYLSAFRYESLGSTSSIGTAVNSKMIKAMPIIVPLEDSAGRYQSDVSPLFERLKAASLECVTLTQLRDTLLPKLISGEIRVPEAKDLVEAAV
jgi:type I restriction enzyme, S subunit